MGTDQATPAKIDRRFDGEPIQVGDRIVQPVCRMTGRQFSAGNEQGGFSGAMAQLQPLEIVVRDGDEKHTIPMADSQRESLRGIVMAGIAVCVSCMLIMLATRRMVRRRLAS